MNIIHTNNALKQHIIGVHMKGKPVYQCSQPNCGKVLIKAIIWIDTTVPFIYSKSHSNVMNSIDNVLTINQISINK